MSKTVLLIGAMTNSHEGFISELSISGIKYKHKLLESKPENWQSIIDILENESIRAIFIKLGQNALYNIGSEEYKNIVNKLFDKISEHPNIIFIYEDYLDNQFINRLTTPINAHEEHEQSKNHTEFLYTLQQLENERMDAVIQGINFVSNSKLNIISYQYNSEVTTLAREFLFQIDQNLLFRIYIPTAQFNAVELNRLIELFKDYLNKTNGPQITIKQEKTTLGSLYLFYAEDAVTQSSFNDEFDDFIKFIHICAFEDSPQIESILKNRDIDPKQILPILTRFQKESKRLYLDINQVYEQKKMALKHRLESELIDYNLRTQEITTIVKCVLPETKDHLNLDHYVHNQESKIIPNVSSDITDKINNIINKELNNNEYKELEEQTLIMLIMKYGKEDKDDLLSRVNILKDTELSKAERISAGQKLKDFIIKQGKEIITSTAGVTIFAIKEFIKRLISY